MAGDPRIRASDADRDRAVAALREHLAAGRLTTEEFDQRLDLAYAAKTLGQLDELMADLPQVDLEQLPDASLRRSVTPWQPGGPAETRPGPGRLSPALPTAWRVWLGVSLFLLVIWLLSGATGGLWFLWVVVPWAAVLLWRRSAGGAARGGRGARRPPRHRDE